MLISNSTVRALDDIAARERDVLQASAPDPLPFDPLSCAPPANAYFVTRDDRGRLVFTSDGAFQIRKGELLDERGNPVLGYVGPGAPLSGLHADPVDDALGFTATAHVDADGSVSYERATIDPRNGHRELQRTALGRLALARFAPGTRLTQVDSGRFAAPEQIAPHLGTATDGNFSSIRPFARSSSIDIDLGLERLQEAYLALDAIRAAGKAQGSVQKTAMDLLK